MFSQPFSSKGQMEVCSITTYITPVLTSEPKSILIQLYLSEHFNTHLKYHDLFNINGHLKYGA